MRAYGYNRPLGMGTYPKGHEVADIVNFPCKQWVEEVSRSCFGYVEYTDDVPTEELERYELVTPEMFEASRPKVPPENVMLKMAEAYRECDWDKLDWMCKVAEQSGYDMEATDAALGKLVGY